MPRYPERLAHRTPNWVEADPLFHIRIRQATDAQPQLTDAALASRLLASALAYEEIGHWRCELFLLMPDHVHALLQIPRSPGLATTVRNWKRLTHRLVGVRWQENFFDHRIRNDSEAMNKWRYIRRNPVVKGLCAREED